MNKAQRAEIEANGVIATNQANLPMIALVYGIAHFECDEIHARIGSMDNDSRYAAATMPLKKYKIRTDKEGRDFFSNGSFRFYLDETIRTMKGRGWA